MKIPVERKVSAYNVKKKKKMVRLNYYVLKQPFWKLFVAMVNDAAPKKKKKNDAATGWWYRYWNSESRKTPRLHS